MAEKAKLKRLSTSIGGPRHQNHVKMNVHILGNAYAMQRWNDQKVVTRAHAKTEQEWVKLVTLQNNVHHSQNQLWSN